MLVMGFKNLFFKKKSSIIPRAGYFKLKQKYSEKKNEVYIFVEDEDDYVFYSISIRQVYQKFKIIPFFQKGKKNVLKAYKEIDWSNFNKSKVLFFVDKDFDDLIKKTVAQHDNLFITKFYSIENYLVNTEVFEIILERIFKGVDSGVISVFMEKISNAHKRFGNAISPIISLILIYRKADEHMDLNKINLSDYFYFDNFKFKRKRVLSESECNRIKQDQNTTPAERIKITHINTLNSIIEKCVEKPELYNFFKLIEIRRELSAIKEKKKYIRGKYELWLLFEIIKEIGYESKKINNKIRAFNDKVENERDKKQIIKKRIELNSNNIFDILPGKIDTPTDILEFLSTNFNKI